MKVYALVWEGCDEWDIHGMFKTKKAAEAAKGYDEEVVEYEVGKRYQEAYKPPVPHAKDCTCLCCHYDKMILKQAMEDTFFGLDVAGKETGKTVSFARFERLGK